MSILRLLIGGGVAYALLNAGKKAIDKLEEQVTWEFQPVEKSDIRLLVGELDFRIKVTNHTGIPIKLKGYTGTVERGGEVIGNIRATGTIELPAQSTKKFKATVQLTGNWGKGSILDPVEVKSILKTSLADVPITHTVSLLNVKTSI